MTRAVHDITLSEENAHDEQAIAGRRRPVYVFLTRLYCSCLQDLYQLLITPAVILRGGYMR
jgi:hypothetical protein